VPKKKSSDYNQVRLVRHTSHVPTLNQSQHSSSRRRLVLSKTRSPRFRLVASVYISPRGNTFDIVDCEQHSWLTPRSHRLGRANVFCSQRSASSSLLTAGSRACLPSLYNQLPFS
jgi:hypothetical protein